MKHSESQARCDAFQTSQEKMAEKLNKNCVSFETQLIIRNHV